MFPKYHVIIGFILSLILFLIFKAITPFAAVIIFFSSFLIDVDHYFYYIFKKRDLSLKNAYKWFLKKRQIFFKKDCRKYKSTILIFHGLEFIILVLVLSYFYDFFLFIAIGAIFHYILDFLETLYYKKPFNGKISQLYNIITNRKKKELKL